MWKPTKKQHLTNKKYVDENGGSGDIFVVKVLTTDGGETYTLINDLQELNDAITNNKAIIGQRYYDNGEDDAYALPVTYLAKDAGLSDITGHSEFVLCEPGKVTSDELSDTFSRKKIVIDMDNGNVNVVGEEITILKNDKDPQ